MPDYDAMVASEASPYPLQRTRLGTPHPDSRAAPPPVGAPYDNANPYHISRWASGGGGEYDRVIPSLQRYDSHGTTLPGADAWGMNGTDPYAAWKSVGRSRSRSRSGASTPFAPMPELYENEREPAGDDLRRVQSHPEEWPQATPYPYPTYAAGGNPWPYTPMTGASTQSALPPVEGGGATNLQRSKSSSAYESLGHYGGGGGYGERSRGWGRRRGERLERPRAWRDDFRVRGSFVGGLIRRLGGPEVNIPQDNTKRILSPYLGTSLTSPRASIAYDLRLPPNPNAIHLPSFGRPANVQDLQRFTHEPPLRSLLLVHERLPWHIPVQASNPSGVTFHDLLAQLYAFLQQQISQRDYHNEEMRAREREDLNEAWAERSRLVERVYGWPVLQEGRWGIKRVDFLRGEWIFEGLRKGNGGLWEIRTRGLRQEERLLTG